MLLNADTITGQIRNAAQRQRAGLVNRRMVPPAAPTPTPMPIGGPQVQPNPAPPTDRGGMVPAPLSIPQPPPPAAPTLRGVSVTGIDPTNDLRNTTIAPTNDVNRFDLVSQRLADYDKTALPAYQAKIRGVIGDNAAMGRVGSGMLNTSVGNEALAAENARNAYFGDLLANATEGTITDAANNRNELRTERGYQTGQEQSAYDRARQGIFDTETLKNADFGRAATLAQLGFGNNPSQFLALLSQISGQNAGAGAAGVGSSSANQSLIDLLKKIQASGGSVPGVNTTPPYVPPYTRSGEGIKPGAVSY